MAQFYTLDESAARLGISPEEFKRRLKTEWTSIRPFRDGATLRFRAADIDELARSLGAASDPGLELAPPGPAAADPGQSSDEFSFTPVRSAPRGANTSDDEPLKLADDSSVEELALPVDSGVNLAPAKKTGDSDVKLEPQARSAAPDPEDALPTEEISLDLGGSGVGMSGSGRLGGPRSGTNLGGPKSGKIPSPADPKKTGSDSSSEFELSLDADSDSFELQMHTDSSDEVDLGAIGLAEENRGGNSGINLGKPSDSGVSLEKKGPKTGPLKPAASPPPDSDDDLVLDLADVPASPSGRNLAHAPASDDSDSEFELSLDDTSGVTDALAAEEAAAGGDIFETDFELPAVGDESGSEVVAVDEANTDLEGGHFEVDATDLDAPVEDDSASQVVLVDDEDAVVVEDDAVVVEDGADVFGGTDLQEGASASKALRGVRRGADEDEDEVPVRTVAAAPPKWGPLPAAVLLPCLLLVFLGGLMSFEALRGMWGYHQPTPPSNMLVRGVADMFGMKTTDAPAK